MLSCDANTVLFSAVFIQRSCLWRVWGRFRTSVTTRLTDLTPSYNIIAVVLFGFISGICNIRTKRLLI